MSPQELANIAGVTRHACDRSLAVFVGGEDYSRADLSFLLDVFCKGSPVDGFAKLYTRSGYSYENAFSEPAGYRLPLQRKESDLF
jgi:hypothetical protein